MVPKLGGRFADGFYAVFVSGQVRFIPKTTDEKTLRALITRNSGEQVTPPPAVDLAAMRKAAGQKGD